MAPWHGGGGGGGGGSGGGGGGGSASNSPIQVLTKNDTEDDVEFFMESTLSPEESRPHMVKHSTAAPSYGEVFATGGTIAELEDDEIVDLASLEPHDSARDESTDPSDRLVELPSHQEACTPSKSGPSTFGGRTVSTSPAETAGGSSQSSPRACTIM